MPISGYLISMGIPLPTISRYFLKMNHTGCQSKSSIAITILLENHLQINQTLIENFQPDPA
jgi:hypothetical protein